MSYAKRANLARMTTTTTGTGTITLGGAVTGYLTFAGAGIADGDVVTYGVESGDSREVGYGTYTSSGTTLSRDTILSSTNSGNAISLTGTSTVFITAAAEDIWDNNNGARAARNRLINGGFSVAQRGTSFTSATTPANNDDSYLLDRWVLLSDGNDIVDVSQVTGEFAGSRYAIRLDVETVDKKFGVCQIIEASDAAPLVGDVCSLSFKCKVSSITNLDNVKAAVVSWSSTADVVTSDLVSSWGAEDTNPTLAANWTYENTPTNLNVTTQETTIKIENISIDTSGATNIAVFVWSDVTTTSLGEFLYITDVQLERGSIATPIEQLPLATVQTQCERYYESSGGSFSGSTITFDGQVTTATAYTAAGRFQTKKRVAPTVTLTNTNAFNFGSTPGSAAGITTSGFYESRTSTASAGRGYFTSTWTAEAEL